MTNFPMPRNLVLNQKLLARITHKRIDIVVLDNLIECQFGLLAFALLLKGCYLRVICPGGHHIVFNVRT